MKKLAPLILFFGLLASCFLPLNKEVSVGGLLSNISEEDRSQEPQIVNLPIGYLFVYKFSKELTDRQCYFMLALIHDVALDTLNVRSDDVIIFAYEGPKRMVTATADLANDEIELWIAENGSDHYVRKLFQGDVVDILAYLIEGYEGNSTLTEGKVSEEVERYLGKKTES